MSFSRSIQFGVPIALTVALAASVIGNERPNVLLITADDLGLQLSCYGDSIITTPNLDELASSSVRFETAYVSQASCSPSRSSMFTGLYPHGNGQYGLLNANVGFRVHEDLNRHLLPNVLKLHGYRTGIIGKLHVGSEKAFAFDVRRSEGFGGRDIDLQIDFAKKFIDSDADSPWFLMFNLFDPHVARDRRANGSRGPQYFPDQVGGIPETTLGPEDVKAWPWQQIETPKQLKKIAGYYNCVQRIDVAIGMLVDVLREADCFDDTVVIFLGDHGPPFSRGKTSCYEAGLRVPFLVRWPGVSEPHASDRLVSSVDIYPTILDAVGVELLRPLHGRSLRPVLTQSSGEDQWRDTLSAEFHYHGASPFFPRRAITDGRFKLIHNLRSDSTAPFQVDGDSAYTDSRSLPEDHPARIAMDRLRTPPEWELYDLQADPNEFDNLADADGMAGTLSRLQSALSRWQQETQDPFVNEAFQQQVVQRYK